MEYSTETRPESFPCIICGGILFRAFEPVEEQPEDGIMCETGGNYGSTMFDNGMDGEHLAFNICDECIVAAADAGRVMIIKRFRPITTDIGLNVPLTVGIEKLDRPYVKWNPALEADYETVELSIDELQHLPKHCELQKGLTIEDIKTMMDANWSGKP